MEHWEIEQDKILNAIRAEIKAKGHTQKSIEARLKMGRGYVSQLLTGTVEIKLKHILQICELLGTSAREVLYSSLDRRETFEFFQQRARRAEALAKGPEAKPALDVAEAEETYSATLPDQKVIENVIESKAHSVQLNEFLAQLDKRVRAIERAVERGGEGVKRSTR